nr:hypothetical protein Itr_chr05CG10640 [Ipomoea trifida]
MGMVARDRSDCVAGSGCRRSEWLRLGLTESLGFLGEGLARSVSGSPFSATRQVATSDHGWETMIEDE